MNVSDTSDQKEGLASTSGPHKEVDTKMAMAPAEHMEHESKDQ